MKKPVATLKLQVQYHADAAAAQEHGKQMVEQLRAQGHTVKAEFVAHEPRKASL